VSTAAPAPAGPGVRTNVALKGPGFELSFEITVPAGPTTTRDLLPLARALSAVMVREAIRAEAAAGREISCRSGCGACCRSLVAISQIEARQIRDLVAGFDAARKAAIEARFEAARQRLQAAGLLARLEGAESWTDADYRQGVGAYFALGIPCPFLEDESCSIYTERPLTCREFLVTSPPAQCAVLGSDAVRPVRLPVAMFNAVARWGVPAQGEFVESWVPLILAPAWADAHPDDALPKPGPELLRELLACMDDPKPDGD